MRPRRALALLPSRAFALLPGRAFALLPGRPFALLPGRPFALLASALPLLASSALGLLVAGCGNAASVPSQPAHTVLPARAVAYLPSSTRSLTAAKLAKEAGTPSLERDLRAWGFRAGAERYFQGESRRLQVVDSRMLRFRSPSGAAAFIRFVTRNPAPYLGSFATLRALSVDGRPGKLLIAQPCQCHLSNPAFLGLLSAGSAVSWLEINGPGATRAALVRLMAQVP